MAAANAFSHNAHDQIAIFDFGSQYSHIITRRVREMGVYCEMHSCLTTASAVSWDRVKGIILSGGPSSVYDADAPHLHDSIWEKAREAKLPVLGICYGFQDMTHRFGGKVDKAPKREFGHAELLPPAAGAVNTSRLLTGVPLPSKVWMSHGDKIHVLPPGMAVTGSTDNCEYAVVEGLVEGIDMFGIQFHPEVSHSEHGNIMLRNFVLDVCGASKDWSMAAFLEEAVNSIRTLVGEDHVIGAVSGGVDSTVAAVLLNRAIGHRFHAVLVDNGLLRKDEAKRVVARLATFGVNLTCVDASEEFLGKLAGVSDPETKRKIIGNTFIHVFEAHAAKIDAPVKYLLQGTLYPDVIESISFKGPSATIKSHHNVGGLLADMKLKLIEPLRELFKDEVRALGMQLGLPEESVNRHPFPGPGLAIRILGEVTKQGCDLLREADDIFISEIRAAGEYPKIGQAFAVLLPCKSVGVMGDCRTYEQVLALRAVATSDYMTADWYHMPYDLLARISTRIINEVRGINRVVYDVSSKPPATIEWE